MKRRGIFFISILGLLGAFFSLAPSSEATKKVLHRPPLTDNTSPDEKPLRYEPIDSVEFCRQTKNPKCDAIINNYCDKACSSLLCASHGSIRGMCRMVCETEDLPPECLKMGPSTTLPQQPILLPPSP